MLITLPQLINRRNRVAIGFLALLATTGFLLSHPFAGLQFISAFFVIRRRVNAMRLLYSTALASALACAGVPGLALTSSFLAAFALGHERGRAWPRALFLGWAGLIAATALIHGPHRAWETIAALLVAKGIHDFVFRRIRLSRHTGDRLALAFLLRPVARMALHLNGVPKRPSEPDASDPWLWTTAYANRRDATDARPGMLDFSPSDALALHHQELWVRTPAGIRIRYLVYDTAPGPKASPAPIWLHVHGISGNILHTARYHEAARRLGFRLFAVELSNHGLSGNNGAGASFGVRESGDVSAVLADVLARNPGAPILLSGTSMGAMAIALCSARVSEEPRVLAVAFECPVSSIMSLLRSRAPRAHQVLAMICEAIERRLGFSLETHAPVVALRKLRKPALVVTSAEDTQVPSAVSREFFEAIPEAFRSRFIEYPRGTHAALWNFQPERFEADLAEFWRSVVETASLPRHASGPVPVTAKSGRKRVAILTAKYGLGHNIIAQKLASHLKVHPEVGSCEIHDALAGYELGRLSSEIYDRICAKPRWVRDVHPAVVAEKFIPGYTDVAAELFLRVVRLDPFRRGEGKAIDSMIQRIASCDVVFCTAFAVQRAAIRAHALNPKLVLVDVTQNLGGDVRSVFHLKKWDYFLAADPIGLARAEREFGRSGSRTILSGPLYFLDQYPKDFADPPPRAADHVPAALILVGKTGVSPAVIDHLGKIAEALLREGYRVTWKSDPAYFEEAGRRLKPLTDGRLDHEPFGPLGDLSRYSLIVGKGSYNQSTEAVLRGIPFAASSFLAYWEDGTRELNRMGGVALDLTKEIRVPSLLEIPLLEARQRSFRKRLFSSPARLQRILSHVLDLAPEALSDSARDEAA